MLKRQCSWAQVGATGMGARDHHYVQCRSMLPALLPAAELLLRSVLDVRHEHWLRSPTCVDEREAAQEARCTDNPG